MLGTSTASGAEVRPSQFGLGSQTKDDDGKIASW